MRLNHLLLGLIVSLLVSCVANSPVTPYTYNDNPQYTWGQTEFFGAYYAGINSNTISLSLYTDSLKKDSIGNLDGIGQYLHIIDVFIPVTDTILQSGTYTAAQTGDAFTFYAKDNSDSFKKNYPFAIINYYEKNSIKSTSWKIINGEFIVTKSADRYTIMFNLITNEQKSIKGSFVGKLESRISLQ